MNNWHSMNKTQITAVEKWGEPSSPKRELFAHALAVEMKGRGFRPDSEQEKQMLETSADQFEVLQAVVKTW